jgi:hypothetical protein
VVRSWLKAISLMIGGVVLGTSACSPDNPVATDEQVLKIPQAMASALEDAPKLLAQAVAGGGKRGEQDEMLRQEATLPGYGGFYIDSVGEVVVHMKPSASISSDAVRRRLGAAYASRPEPIVREVMARASRARVVEGQFSLSELISIEHRIGSSPILLRGFAGVGTSIFLNRVKVGFEDSTTLREGIAALARIGVPMNSVIPEVWGRFRLASNWNSTVRPVRGGLQDGIVNRSAATPNSFYGVFGTLGYNVRGSDGVDYIMISGHGVLTFGYVNGEVGDSITQPRPYCTPSLTNFCDIPTEFVFPFVGKIVRNPRWDEGAACPMDPTNPGQHYDFCTDSDVALATYFPGIGFERKIGTSDYEGQNGNFGCCDGHIHQWNAIQMKVEPEFVRMSGRAIYKSGATSGTTSGALDLPSVDMPAELATSQCWDVPTPCPPSFWKRVLIQGLVRVSHAGSGPGDSGGVVFSNYPGYPSNGAPYVALGVFSGTTGAQAPFDCSASNCAFYFGRWSNMERRLGLTINPATTQ